MISESKNSPTRFPDPNSQSARLQQRARQVLPGGNTRTTVFHDPYPIYAQSAQGCRITDVDGVERLDFLNNYTALIHGHLNPGILEAVRGQLELGTCFANPTESEIALAEELCRRTPSFERVRFANSGSEAVMNAIKAARAYTGRPKVAKCEGLYHGSYDPVEVSLDSSPDSWGDGPPASVAYSAGTPQGVLDDVVVIPFNETEPARSILAPEAGALAAVIVDIMPNRGGLIPARPEFLTMLREFTSRHGIVLIFDEVITGFRLAWGGAQELYRVKPDLTCLGKIVGGGLPAAAYGGRRDLMAQVAPEGPVYQAGTLSGNPLAMAAGLAVLAELAKPGIYQKLEATSTQLAEGMLGIAREVGVEFTTVAAGGIFGFFFHPGPIQSFEDAKKAHAGRFKRFHQSMLEQGIYLAPSPFEIGFASLAHQPRDLDTMLEAARVAMQKAARVR